MRIAIFTDTYVPDRNGASASINQFTRLMADDGNQIIIFCPKAGHYKDRPYDNITVKRYQSVTAPTYKDFKLALPFIWTAVKDLKEFAPDVVHIQTPLGIGWMGIWATKILKIKNIQTYHTYIPDFLVYIKPRSLIGINRITDLINGAKLARKLDKIDVSDESYESIGLKPLLEQITKERESEEKKNKTNKLDERFGRQYTRMVYNRADLVLTPSLAMKKLLKKQGVEPKIEVMSNGIDYDFFKKKTSYAIGNKIVNIGRLGFEKRVDITIQAFAVALKDNPKLRLDIYGDGPAKKSLQVLAKKLGVSKNIKFWGVYDIAKVSQKLCEYDCLATASPIETEGIVLLEAMASGLPILGVRKLAVPDIIKDGKNGYLSNPSDIDGMSRNMLKIMESSKVLERLGKNALEVAKEHEVRICKKRLFGFYEKIAKS